MWYCLQIKNKQEFNCEQRLDQQGYRTYLPRVYIGSKKRKNNIVKVEPLFPGYMFIHLEEGEDDFAAVKHTRGVVNFVNKQLIPVPDSVIEELRHREDAQGVHKLISDDFQEGEKVRIKQGVFKFYEAVIAAREDQRIYVILNMMGGQRIRVNPQDIESIQ